MVVMVVVEDGIIVDVLIMIIVIKFPQNSTAYKYVWGDISSKKQISVPQNLSCKTSISGWLQRNSRMYSQRSILPLTPFFLTIHLGSSHYPSEHCKPCIFPITALLGPYFHLHLCWASRSLSPPQQALWSHFCSSGPRDFCLVGYNLPLMPPPGKYHQYPQALMVPKCRSSKVQIMGRPFSIWHLVIKWTAYAPMSARWFRAPTPSQFTLSHPNVLRICTLIVSVLFTAAIPHITQWQVHINASIKVFWMNVWVQW